MNKKIKTVGIVNYGSIAKKYLRVLSCEYPLLKINVFTSQNINGHNTDKISFFKNFNKFASSGIDAAIICSPPNQHVNQIIKLANKKIHVLVEKPISNSTRNLKRAFSVIKSNKLVLSVGYLLRNDNGLKKLKILLNKKIIGKIVNASIECRSFLPEWRKSNYKKSVSSLKELGGGALLELSHEIDYLEILFGKIKFYNSIIYNSRSLKIDAEDNVLLNVLTNKNFLINLSLDFCSRINVRKTVVRGLKGNLTWDFFKDKIYLNLPKKKVKNILYKSNKKNLLKLQLNLFFKRIINKNLHNNYRKEFELIKKILIVKKTFFKKI